MNPRRSPKLIAGTRCRGGWLLPALAGWTLVAGGCAEPYLETSYGGQRRVLTTSSVNGTDVLAAMFTAAGHEVDTCRTLITSEMQSVDTIVWFPDDFAAPDSDVCEWLDDWLAGRSGRTLIYVGRDFDAAPLYWRKMAPLAPPHLREIYRDRETQSVVRARLRADEKQTNLECDWFKIDPSAPRDVRELAGPWGKEIQAPKSQIELGAKLVPSVFARRYLTSSGDLLAARARLRHWDESQLILVANGSFLLNLPLVNREHRKLAGKLIETAGSPGRVVFLESGPGGPSIDPPQADNSFWNVFGAWPLNAILLHLAAVGLIFCFARWPIFGRPRVPPEQTTSDFGKHVDALGELLRRTKDRNYALSKLAEIDNAPGPHVP